MHTYIHTYIHTRTHASAFAQEQHGDHLNPHSTAMMRPEPRHPAARRPEAAPDMGYERNVCDTSTKDHPTLIHFGAWRMSPPLPNCRPPPSACSSTPARATGLSPTSRVAPRRQVTELQHLLLPMAYAMQTPQRAAHRTPRQGSSTRRCSAPASQPRLSYAHASPCLSMRA